MLLRNEMEIKITYTLSTPLEKPVLDKCYREIESRARQYNLYASVIGDTSFITIKMSHTPLLKGLIIEPSNN
jgi:hypothetical protein